MNQGLSKKRVKKTNPKALGISIMQEENKRFQVICSSKNDAIITSDETKLITFWNKGAESIFGYTAEEAVGKPMTLIIPNQYQQRHNDGIERMNQ